MKKNILVAKYFLPFVLLVLMAAYAGPSVRAQDQTQYYQYMPIVAAPEKFSWIGPQGGSVTALATDPKNASILYAGTRGTGVFKTINGGDNWSPANKNISTLTIDSLAVDPSNPAIVYAGTDGQGVYKTTDGGANWGAANQGVKANSLVLALAVNPGNPDLVYAATQTQGTTNGVLYKSTDRGANWTAVLTQTGDWVNSLAVNPYKPYTMLAATENHGPYITTNYGSSGQWGGTTISGGDPRYGMIVAFDPRSATSRAYWITRNENFYRSTNNGVNWSYQNSILGASSISRNGLAINPRAPDTLYLATSSSDTAGVLRSDDHGSNWRSVGLKGKKVNTVVVSTDGTTVFAGTDQEGVYRSQDGGSTWIRSTAGLGNSFVTGMVFNGTSTFYSSTFGGGVFKSTDVGANWTNFSSNLNDIYINGLIQHPTQPSIIFALTASSGLHRYDMSGSGGWLSPVGLPEFLDQPNVALPADPATALATVAVGINGMAFAPSNTNIAYLATNGSGVYASSDSGVSFNPKGLAGEVVKSVTVNSTDPNTLYVATSVKGVVKKSTDGGINWASIALPDAQLSANAMAMCPGEADSVCVGTSNGVWSYAGGSWEPAGLQGYSVSCLVPGPVGVLVAGTSRGAFSSYNHQTWNLIGLTVGTYNVASLNFNPAEKFVIYIGTVDRGTLRVSFNP